MDNLIINTPSVSDQFAEVVSEAKNALINSLINIIINVIGVIALIVYLAQLYSVSNRKRIAVMRMNGYKFIEIYNRYIISQLAVNMALLFIQLLIVKTNIILFFVFAVLDMLLFAFKARRCEHKQILSVMKEGC